MPRRRPLEIVLLFHYELLIVADVHVHDVPKNQRKLTVNLVSSGTFLQPFNVYASETCSAVSLGFACSVKTGFGNVIFL